MSTKHLPEWVGPFDGYLYRMEYTGECRGWSAADDSIGIRMSEFGWTVYVSIGVEKTVAVAMSVHATSPIQLVRRFNAACKRLGRMGE